MRQLVPLVLTITTAVACGDEPSPEDCDPPSDPQAFEVGTGELCFTRVQAGETLPLMAGPQGGYHVWLAVGCKDCGEEAHLRMRVFAEDGTEMSDLATEQFVPLGGDAWPQHAGIQLGMPGFDGESGRLPVGTPLRVQVETVDGSGSATHAGEMSFILGETESWDGGGRCSDCN